MAERGGYRQLPASPSSVVDVALAIQPATRALDIVVHSSGRGRDQRGRSVGAARPLGDQEHQ